MSSPSLGAPISSRTICKLAGLLFTSSVLAHVTYSLDRITLLQFRGHDGVPCPAECRAHSGSRINAFCSNELVVPRQWGLEKSSRIVIAETLVTTPPFTYWSPVGAQLPYLSRGDSVFLSGLLRELTKMPCGGRGFANWKVLEHVSST